MGRSWPIPPTVRIRTSYSIVYVSWTRPKQKIFRYRPASVVMSVDIQVNLGRPISCLEGRQRRVFLFALGGVLAAVCAHASLLFVVFFPFLFRQRMATEGAALGWAGCGCVSWCLWEFRSQWVDIA
ncbi:hypothetical protein LY76DRAFT_23581 [Colletotrichum caudatum]|nr:hypothetical protein LY76DRAFT_23581 [Colletotrichum caudatum]